MSVIHVDDVEPMELDQGELRWTARRRLAGPAGCAQVGLSLFELPPGGRSTPPHVHADEEEICVVLRGTGLSLQDREAFTVAEGDVLVHPCNGAAHTLVAGDDGLTFLMFGEGSRTNLTYMPRTKKFWAANRWIPAEGTHPFAADAELGPMEIPEAELPAPVFARTTTRFDRVTLAQDETTPAGCHSAEEAIAYVLGGEGSVTFGDDEPIALCEGSVVGLPAGDGIPHAFTGPLELLMFGTVVPGDAVWFPERNEVRVRGLPVPLRPA
ncbi:MAG: cupin domain-containing protein [Solirubrobacteraceae bacterium]|nr:cupin domain-containing protein [Solirubrobacteraceae bacterium]